MTIVVTVPSEVLLSLPYPDEFDGTRAKPGYFVLMIHVQSSGFLTMTCIEG
jgi:hypothetical protein